MESLITLANGDVTAPDKLRHYFDTVFAAEDSGEEFPVTMSGGIWRIGYTRKDNAVAALRKTFVEGVDYQVSLKVQENPEGGRPEEEYSLTTSCAEYFAVRANREVFEVYVNCRKAIKNILRGNMPDFSDPVAAARAWADAEEGKRKALAEASVSAAQLEQARPKIEFAEAVAIAANSVPMSAAAKYLKLPGVGRNKLFRMLRADRILQANNEPYQSQIDAGHFEVEPQHYKAGEKGERIAGTTRVTGKGLQYLQKRYKKPVGNI
ncbi:phage antirepressor KilAC domain-containing protein [Hymenobacter ruber]